MCARREYNIEEIEKEWVDMKLASVLQLQDQCDQNMDKGYSMFNILFIYLLL